MVCIKVCNIEASSPRAIVSLCVGKVWCTGSAGGSLPVKTAGREEQRLTNRLEGNQRLPHGLP